jgi:nucleoside triphosphate diphosphatase
MSTRAAAVGFDWDRPADVLAKIEEEVAELREAVERSGGATAASSAGAPDAARGAWLRVEEEMGDLLFALANLSRKLGIEPEAALRRADDKFAKRFTQLERRFAERGESLREAGLARMEEEWARIKGDE